MLFAENGLNVVDLHVYVDGSASLLTDRLYDFTYAEETPDFPLPFTYPPFAALVFFPLHYLPFTAVAVGWMLATVAALYGVIRISFELLLGAPPAPRPRGINPAGARAPPRGMGGAGPPPKHKRQGKVFQGLGGK
ncbi:glycosyltransferase 87 family protein, partial [Nocardia neocaledoniensis]|uniref:glycosyltransferase 87 family protein n=1 Tax=Nocardia neocaledoniensis TaxID=236511 RepID=UPI002457DE73